MSTPSPVSRSTRRRSPSSGGSSSSGRERVQDGHVAARAGELADGPLGVWIEEVADEHQRAALRDLRGVVADTRRQGRSGPVDGLTPDRSARTWKTRPVPRTGGKAPRRPALQHGHAHAVIGGEPDIGQGRRGSLAEQQLVGRAAVHRRRRVEQDVDGDVLFLDEELDEQLLEAGVEVPVQRAQVVAQACSRDSR